MISTLLKWSKISTLRDIVRLNPDKVHIDGVYMHKGSNFSGKVNTIPFGDTIVVNHSKTRYYFKKEVDGSYTVY